MTQDTCVACNRIRHELELSALHVHTCGVLPDEQVFFYEGKKFVYNLRLWKQQVEYDLMLQERFERTGIPL